MVDNPYESPQAELMMPAVRNRPDRGLLWLLFSFNGRIGRSTFWGASLATYFIFLTLNETLALAVGQTPGVFQILAFALYAPFLWICLAMQVKRWHDHGKSGWWALIGLIPCVGGFVVLIEVGCMPGIAGPNQYGDDRTGCIVAGARIGNSPDRREIELNSAATDADLARIAGNAEIEDLRLGGTQITDLGLEHLKNLVNLRHLDLSLTSVTDDGLRWILDLPVLATLWLGGTAVSDDGLLQLAAVETLANVYLKKTRVTEEGMRRFNELRPYCTIHP